MHMNKREKVLLASTSVAIFTGALFFYAIPKLSYTLHDQLTHYGFDNSDKKQAFKSLLIQSGAVDSSRVDKFLLERCNKEELVSKIIELVRISQENFVIRKGNQERWDVKKKTWMTSDVSEKLKTLGYFSSVTPALRDYNILVVLGARKTAMQSRIDYLDKLVESGSINPSPVILLAGERYVSLPTDTAAPDGSMESLEQLAQKTGKELSELTEVDIILDIFKRKNSPKLTRRYSIIDVPRGELQRPNTCTTITALIEFLIAHAPSLKYNILFVSNQPNVHYQKMVITETLREVAREMKVNTNGIKVDVVGPGVTNKVEIAEVVGGLGSGIWAQSVSLIRNLNPILTPAQEKDLISLYPGRDIRAEIYDSPGKKISPM